MNHSLLFIRLPMILLAGIALLACSPDTPEASAEKPAAVSGAEPAEETTKPFEVPEAIVVVGLDGLMNHLKQEGWWGEESRDEQLTVPHLMITRIHPAWRVAAPNLPVPQKKEIFYRLMLPLVMHANAMVLDRRAKLMRARDDLAAGKQLSAEELDDLKRAVVLLRVMPEADAAALTAASPGLTGIVERVTEPQQSDEYQFTAGDDALTLELGELPPGRYRVTADTGKRGDDQQRPITEVFEVAGDL